MRGLLAACVAGLCLGAPAVQYELLPNVGLEDVKDGMPVGWFSLFRQSKDLFSVTNDAQRGTFAAAVKTPAKVDPDTVCLYTGTDGGGRGGYPVVPGATYRMKAMVRSTNAAMVRFYLNLRDGGGGFLGGSFSDDFHTIDEWREYSFFFKIPAQSGVRKVGAGVMVYSPDNVVRIDNVSLVFDTTDNPGVKDIYRRDPPPTVDLGLKAEGAAIRVDGTKEMRIAEGLHAVVAMTDGKGPVRFSCPKFPLVERRWRIREGKHPDAKDPLFDDGAWTVAEFDADGTLKLPKVGVWTLRQVILWNATKNSEWKLFLAGTERYSIPAGAVDPLLAALYSPFGRSLADFTINFDLPDGFRFADVSGKGVRDDYRRRDLPRSVVREGSVWSFAYGEVKANATRKALLPLVAPEPLADGLSFRYWRTANGNFTELPVTVPVGTLPPIRNVGVTPFVIEGYETGLLPPTSEEHACLHFAQTARIGENRFFLSDESASFAKAYEEANPNGLFVHATSGSFPLTLRLWGHIDWTEQAMIDFMKANPGSQVRFKGGAFKPLMKKDAEHNIHYAAWCPSWINGEGKSAFQAKLTEVFTEARRRNPKLRRGWIDWETNPLRGGQAGVWCFCETCKARFAAEQKLKSVPADDEIVEKYAKEWEAFRFANDAQSVRTMQTAMQKAGVDLLVYSGDQVYPFWDLNGEIKEIFATVPGNSPAIAYRQAFMEKLRGGICARAKQTNFIAQRFARLGPTGGPDGWKTMTVCSSDGVHQDDKLWKSQVIRMLVTCQGGMDIQNFLYYPASVQYWMAEGVAAVKPYANLVRGGWSAPERFSSGDIAFPDAVVVEKEGAVLACLFNEGETARTVTFTLCGRTETVTIPPQDAVLAFRPSGPTTPSERRDWAGPHSGWYTKCAGQRAGQTLDLVILGDSINHMWNLGDPGEKVWKENFDGLKCENFAMAGDRTEHLLWRITEGRQLDGYTAKTVLVMIGINNSHQVRPGASRSDTPSEAAPGVKAILDIIRTKQPQAKVLLLGCLPAHFPGCDRLAWTREYNDIVRTYADGKQVVYYELRDVFLKDEKTLDQSYFKDGIHLNEKGFRTYAAFLKGLLCP